MSGRVCPIPAQFRGLAASEGWAPCLEAQGSLCPLLPGPPVEQADFLAPANAATAERQWLNNSEVLGILTPCGRPTAGPEAFHLDSSADPQPPLESIHTPEGFTGSLTRSELAPTPYFSYSCGPARAISLPI